MKIWHVHQTFVEIEISLKCRLVVDLFWIPDFIVPCSNFFDIFWILKVLFDVHLNHIQSGCIFQLSVLCIFFFLEYILRCIIYLNVRRFFVFFVECLNCFNIDVARIAIHLTDHFFFMINNILNNHPPNILFLGRDLNVIQFLDCLLQIHIFNGWLIDIIYGHLNLQIVVPNSSKD